MKDQKWECTKCGATTFIKPESKNATCKDCGRGRYKSWYLCECGIWFHPNRLEQKFCSKECAMKFRNSGGKKGKHYPNTQRARIAICPTCGKEFRAIHEYAARKSVYCSKDCWSHRGRKYERKIVRSPEFNAWKRAVFDRDNRTCQICGERRNLEAHHIKEKRNFPELQFEVSNGLCLCHEFHKKTDNYGRRAISKAGE